MKIPISVEGIIGIIFIILKLMHVIAWSWLWVLAPFWIPLILFIGVFTVIFVVLFIAMLISLAV